MEGGTDPELEMLFHRAAVDLSSQTLNYVAAIVRRHPRTHSLAFQSALAQNRSISSQMKPVRSWNTQ
ncbi:hypothetical protein AB0K05_39665 [Nonomuraea sp. NPDC049486]|uniref:hypothetical protein n=1 Tax=Nonomuraea sp. NPDC049486 TaxID=3155773 RepID=UPI00343614E9